MNVRGIGNVLRLYQDPRSMGLSDFQQMSIQNHWRINNDRFRTVAPIISRSQTNYWSSYPDDDLSPSWKSRQAVPDICWSTRALLRLPRWK